jgi:hypothetical protein
VKRVARSLALGLALGLAAASAAAAPGWWISTDAEHFRWEESGSPSVTETGPRYGLSWGYLAERPAGWQFGYRGQFRRGTVDYNGALLFTGQPTTARTQYTGLLNEAQALYRLAPRSLDLLAGLGFDYWERNILPAQYEDYSVVYLRLGLNYDPRENLGFFAGGGVKLPLYVREDAHLGDLGATSNPYLEPKSELSVYAELGYRFARQWSVIGYYDGYRFGESSAVRVTVADATACAPAAAPCSLSFFQPASKVDSYGLRLQYNFR